jgi:predicted PurR-regulated permease PerM
VLPNSQIRQILLLLLISSLFGLIFWNLRLFIPAFLGAYTLYVLLRKPMHLLEERFKWNKYLAIVVLLLASLTLILLPINGLIRSIGAQLADSFQHSDQLLLSIQNLLAGAEAYIGIPILTPERLQEITQWGVHSLSNLLNATFMGVLQVFMAYIILWFMLTESKKMETAFFNWLPLKAENTDFVRTELNDLVYSNALGIPLMGIVQGLTGMLGYWLAGVEDLWFWVFMTAVAGTMPLFGVSLAFLPLSLLLFSKGLAGQGAFVFAYGFLVIGSVDNLARMWLLKKIGHTHPLITLFGVIIGLQLFGFIGFIFGPIMIAMFQLLVKIYQKEFK